MAMDSINALRASVFQTLSEDSVLKNLAAGIYDYRGETQAFPYVYVDVMEAEEWSKLTSRGATLSLTIFVATREKESQRCTDILARIQTVLHRANLELTGFTLHFIRWVDTRLQEQNSANTFTGTARFTARLIEV